MTDNAQMPGDLSARGLLLTLALALAVSVLVVFAAVLPAEYGRDPTGLGKLTGLSGLWKPDEIRIDPNAGVVARSHAYDIPYRSDLIEIDLETMGRAGAKYEIEYKVRMQKDASIVFDWEAVGTEDPEDFYYDFHGHTLAQNQEAMTVAIYRQGSAQRAGGALTAPFDGIHGWYFQNSAAGKVTVRIRVSGFYELIAPGEPGNEAGVTNVRSVR